MQGQNLLRLLIVDESVDDAEHLISVLRNSGLAVRPNRAEDAEQLQAALERQPLDLIVHSTSHSELTVGGVTAAVDRSGKDLPVIVISDQIDADFRGECIREGARDFACRSETDHLVFVIKRELAELQRRRKLRRMEASLRESERRCNALLDSSRDAIAYVHEGMHVYANPAYLAMFAFEDFDDIEGMPILDMIAKESHDSLKGVLRDLSKGKKPPSQLEVRCRHQDGSSIECFMEFSPASIDGEPCNQIVLRQQQADPALAKELADLRTQDMITGLFNRQHFNQELDRAVKDAIDGETDAYLLIAQIDEFRGVLDQVGIGNTDLILRDAAQLMRGLLTENDIPARLADQTFAILVRRGGLKEAEQLGQMLCKKFDEQVFEVGKSSVGITISVGITPVGDGRYQTADLISHASSGVREAAEVGGNRAMLHVVTTADEKAEQDIQQWLTRIKDALENDKFALVFQPIVNLHGEGAEHYELLLRMVADDGDDIMPAKFLPVAERYDLMPEIDRWVVTHGLRLLKERADGTVFFIKITPATVSDRGFLPWLSRRLQAARVPGNCIVFEMPESLAVTNLKPAREFLKGVKQLNCRFALEQFGSGLNSFKLLKHLPADILKIDRSFMTDLAGNEEHQAKVRQITDQAHAEGKMTIAEFVEDAASMSFLFGCGVNFVQGNFLQEPEKVLAYEFAV